MTHYKSFEDLEIWRRSREICNNVYEVYLRSDLQQYYGLWNQINRSTGSVMDNIARGFDRDRNKEIIQFLSIATSSCKASKSQLYPCLDRKYVTTNHFENISTKIDPRKVQTAGFMKYLKYCDHKANKYDKNVKQPQRSNRQSNCDRN